MSLMKDAQYFTSGWGTTAGTQVLSVSGSGWLVGVSPYVTSSGLVKMTLDGVASYINVDKDYESALILAHFESSLVINVPSTTQYKVFYTLD